MNTKLTVLAALMLAGASQAALAQEHDQDRWHNPGDRAAPRQAPAPQAAPQAAPQPPPRAQPAPGGGPGQWAGHRGGDRFQGAPPAAQPAPPQPGQRMGGDRRFQGDQHFQGDQQRFQGDQRGGERRFEGRNGFAPGAGDGDRRWDRREAPREVVPPGPNAERGWDRDHDGHGPAPNYANRPPRDGDRRWAGDGQYRYGDGRWDRDGRGPPANWRHWERGRLPPIYAAPHRYRVGAYHRPYGWYVRSWGFGDFLPRGWFAPDYWIGDFWDYDLPYPPPGFHWVRVGDDALLVDDYSGRIVQVVNDIFW